MKQKNMTELQKKVLNEIELKICWKEFKLMIINRLTRLDRRVEELSMKLQRDR